MITIYRKDYQSNLTSKDMSTRQRATAMWVVDILALRVGGEKGGHRASRDNEQSGSGCRG